MLYKAILLLMVLAEIVAFIIIEILFVKEVRRWRK